MATSTQLFLAYVAYKARSPANRKSFAEYIAEKPDLAALILVAHFSAENGIAPPIPRGRKRIKR